jgi:hypothetical protein
VRRAAQPVTATVAAAFGRKRWLKVTSSSNSRGVSPTAQPQVRLGASPQRAIVTAVLLPGPISVNSSFSPEPCNQSVRFTDDLAFADDLAVRIHNAHALRHPRSWSSLDDAWGITRLRSIRHHQFEGRLPFAVLSTGAISNPWSLLRKMIARLMEMQAGAASADAPADPRTGAMAQAGPSADTSGTTPPTNIHALKHLWDRWKRLLSRRSQKGNRTWTGTAMLADYWIPQPRILHPCPEQRLAVTHPS